MKKAKSGIIVKAEYISPDDENIFLCLRFDNGDEVKLDISNDDVVSSVLELTGADTDNLVELDLDILIGKRLFYNDSRIIVPKQGGTEKMKIKISELIFDPNKEYEVEIVKVEEYETKTGNIVPRITVKSQFGLASNLLFDVSMIRDLIVSVYGSSILKDLDKEIDLEELVGKKCNVKLSYSPEGYLRIDRFISKQEDKSEEDKDDFWGD